MIFLRRWPCGATNIDGRPAPRGSLSTAAVMMSGMMGRHRRQSADFFQSDMSKNAGPHLTINPVNTLFSKPLHNGSRTDIILQNYRPGFCPMRICFLSYSMVTVVFAVACRRCALEAPNPSKKIFTLILSAPFLADKHYVKSLHGTTNQALPSGPSR